MGVGEHRSWAAKLDHDRAKYMHIEAADALVKCSSDVWKALASMCSISKVFFNKNLLFIEFWFQDN